MERNAGESASEAPAPGAPGKERPRWKPPQPKELEAQRFTDQFFGTLFAPLAFSSFLTLLCRFCNTLGLSTGQMHFFSIFSMLCVAFALSNCVDSIPLKAIVGGCGRSVLCTTQKTLHTP